MGLYEMTALLKFNRPISKNLDYIVPGGYEIRFKDGKNCMFDFMDYTGSIDTEAKECLSIEVRGADDSFDDFIGSDIPMNKLTSEMIKDMAFFSEFFVYTGEADEHGADLALVEIKECTLCFHEDGKRIEVPLTKEQRQFISPENGEI